MPSVSSSHSPVFVALLNEAVRASSGLIGALIAGAEAQLAREEMATPNAHHRQALAEAMRELAQRRQTMARQFALALREEITTPAGAASKTVTSPGLDSLSLMDDADMQVHLEFTHTRQQLLGAVSRAQAELDKQVSILRGRSTVDPQHNPLRAEAYLNALRRTISSTGVSAQVVQTWMERWRPLLGEALAEQIAQLSEWVRAQQAPAPSPVVAPSAHTTRHTPVRHERHSRPQPDAYDDELLTVNELEQQIQQVIASPDALRQLLQSEGLYYQPAPAAAAPDSGSHGPRSGGMSTRSSRMGVASGFMPADVVDRMMANIARDARLLPQIQQVVQALAPALRRLVQHDDRFFSDDQHPARRLLDELTQRSLAFHDAQDSGFARFIRVAAEAVEHLAASDAQEARDFDMVLHALQQTWTKGSARATPAAEPAPPAAAPASAAPAVPRGATQAQKSDALAQRIGEGIRRMSETAGVPDDIMDFASVPWARVAAHAQMRSPHEEDPGGYLALVPLLFWSVQPEMVRSDPALLDDSEEKLRTTLAQGLRSVGHTEDQISSFLARVAQLHRRVRAALSGKKNQRGAAGVGNESAPMPLPLALSQSAPPPQAFQDEVAAPATPEPAAAAAPVASQSQAVAFVPAAAAAPIVVRPDTAPQSVEAAPESLPATERLAVSDRPAAPEPPLAPEPAAQAVEAAQAGEAANAADGERAWVPGLWVEVMRQGRSLTTQLTWVHTNGALFLFTAPDSSTLSMTLRMRDRLLAEGALRVLDGAPVVAGALGAALAGRTARKR